MHAASASILFSPPPSLPFYLENEYFKIKTHIVITLYAIISLFIYLFIYLFFVFSRAAPMAYGGSQARGRIGAVVISLHQSHSNTGSEPSLQHTPQLTALLDP